MTRKAKRSSARSPMSSLTPRRKRPSLVPRSVSSNELPPVEASKHRTNISAFEINRCAVGLFPRDYVEDRPSVAPRIFAFYALHSPKNDQTHATRGLTNLCELHYKHVDPILPLLRALVEVEAVSLGPTDQPDLKRIHFSGFDGSAMQPPIDRVDGSEMHQQKSLEALVRAKEVIEELFNQENAGDQRLCLESMVQFLAAMMTGDSGKIALEQCALAVSPAYVAKRFEKAVVLYESELRLLVERMRNPSRFRPLFVENRLAEIVGQAIRYRLRMFFNKAPPRLSPDDKTYEQRACGFSKVHRLIEMTLDDDQESIAVDDSCIAALVSNAIRRIAEYFGLDMLEPAIPVLFCASPATNRGIPIRGPADDYSEQELHEIFSDIDEASTFAAATRAGRFLIDLMSAPGVQDEIARHGGWAEVETYATICWKHHLWHVCPNDDYLILLSNYSVLESRLRMYIPTLEQHLPACLESLAAVTARFHLNTKSKNLLGRFPQIKEIAFFVDECKKRANYFPAIKPRGTEDIMAMDR